MVTDSATVTMESLEETTIALSNGVIADPIRPPLRPKWGFHMPQYTRMAISLQRVIRSTSCLVLGWGFRGRRIERRYLRFEQIQDGGRRHLIQDGGRRHLGKISNGYISATGRPIHFMFVYRVGFRGGGSNGAIFDSNKFKMAAVAILDNFEWPYLRNSLRSTSIARIARSSLR